MRVIVLSLKSEKRKNKIISFFLNIIFFPPREKFNYETLHSLLEVSVGIK